MIVGVRNENIAIQIHGNTAWFSKLTVGAAKLSELMMINHLSAGQL